MAYKMKGFSGFKSSPAKQEGPIPKKNIKLQKGEMEGTWIYPGGDKGERITDYEDRVEFARSDAESSEGKEKEQHLANAKKLQHEADIIRNRKSPGKMYGKKSPAKQGLVKPKKLTPQEEWNKLHPPGIIDKRNAKPPKNKPTPPPGIITPPKKKESPAKQKNTLMDGKGDTTPKDSKGKKTTKLFGGKGNTTPKDTKGKPVQKFGF